MSAPTVWTTQPPTEDGYYWQRDGIAEQATIVRITGRFVYPIGLNGHFPLNDYGPEWYGPLPEPGGDAIENGQGGAR